MNPALFDWTRFHAYRVFDEFLERLILNRKSYVTRHEEQLDLEVAFEDIRTRFIGGADESETSFEDKVARQFQGASEQTRIAFANVEYLWAMPMENITREKKRSYALRWFAPSQVVNGDSYFFSDPHTIADPGPWYLTNKYWEIIAALRVLSMVAGNQKLKTVDALKARIAKICHDALYQGVPPGGHFSVGKFCGIHPALMHLAAPERYESIISGAHRRQIIEVFGHIIANPPPDRETYLKEIRTALYDSHGRAEDPDRKYRWFFYSKDIKPLWIGKKGQREQHASSAIFDVRAEEDAADLEGTKEEVKGYRIRRSAKLTQRAKKRDRYSCRACNFHFERQIVHVHHLDPLGEYQRPKDTKLADLVTLCPNCHYLAHYWLRKSTEFKNLAPLISKLKAAACRS